MYFLNMHILDWARSSLCYEYTFYANSDGDVQFLPSNRWLVQKARSSAVTVHSVEKLSSEREGFMCMCVCMCVHVRAAQIGRQAVLTRMWIVCAQRCDTRWESYSTKQLELFLLYVGGR